jgi:hypothetical protein
MAKERNKIKHETRGKKRQNWEKERSDKEKE